MTTARGADRRNLSVCAITRDPPERVAAMLSMLREVAGEIVVAYDHRVPVGTLAPVLAVADRVIRVEVAFPLERSLRWLYSQCTRRWILRVDGDEAPSVALVERLRELPDERRISHAFAPRRWLWPTADAFLADDPWDGDVHPRLLRNDVALASCSPLVHDIASIPGAALFWEEPFYHLDLLLNGVPAREEKAAWYEALRPGLRTNSGRALNTSFYLPEASPDRPRLATVPPDDLAALRSMLDATAARPSAGGANNLPIVPADAVLDATARPSAGGANNLPIVPADALLDASPEPLGEGAYQAKIEPLQDRVVLAVGRSPTILVRVTNLGSEQWHFRDDGWGVKVGARWCTSDGSVLQADAGRGWFPCDIAPGSAIVVRVEVPPPGPPERYRLEFDLVNELVRWFGCGSSMEVVVRRNPRVVICSGHSPFRHLGDDVIIRGALVALALNLPMIEPVLLDRFPGLSRPDFAAEIRSDAHAALAIQRRSSRLVVAFRLFALLRDARRAARGWDLAHERNREVIEAVNGSDLVLLLSAGALTSRYWRELWAHAAVALVGRSLKVPVALAGVGVGPYRGVWDRLVASALFRSASVVMTRDGGRSRRELLRLGARRRRVIGGEDLARFMVRGPAAQTAMVLAGHGLHAGDAYAVVSLRATPGGDPAAPIVAALLDELAEAGLALLYLPHVEGAVGENDVDEGLRLARSDPRVTVLDPMPPDAVAVAVVAGAAVTVGSRFHLSVVAAGAGVPSLALVDDHKDDYDRRRVEGLRCTTSAPVEIAGLVDGVPAARRALVGLLRRESPRRPAPDLVSHPVVDLVRRFVELETPV
jgi:polysaccharide pyruvyl transferase WcaK-like protein